MSLKDATPDQIVETYWPYDGPHSGDSVVAAAAAVAELLRYMANALWTVRPNGPTLYRVLSRLNAASYGVDEVLDHLRDATKNLVGDPTMYDDRRDRPAAETAREVLEFLNQARLELAPGRQRLEKAAQLASHLGHDSVRGE